jgi:peptidoglycan/LPS O-acetylase OafA/YrhL
VRLHYLDTLRVLAVATVFVFHAFRPFNVTDWLVMNDETSPIAIAFQALVGPWGMPFFFLLSGAGTWFALRRRTPRQYAVERVTRLLVPYLLGSLLLTPIQGYFDWRFWSAREEQSVTFLQFMLDRLQGLNPTVFDWIGYHLWFLAFLFCVSLIALPFLLLLRRAQGQRWVGRLADLCLHRGGILVFLLPLLIIQMGLRPLAPQSYGWSDFVYYLVFFIIGALFVSDERFARAIRRDWWLALIIGVAAFLGLVGLVALGVAEIWFADPDLPGFYLWWVVATLDTWPWIVVMWFVGMRYLDVSNRWLRYGQEAIVPFYVFHQPVIVAISFYVVQWQLGVTLKMLVIFFGSLAITLAIVELIRRIAPLRALFGMKVAGRPLTVRPQESTPSECPGTPPPA